MKFLIIQFLHPPATSSLLRPSIPLSTHHLCPSLQVRDRVIQPRPTEKNCVFVCVLYVHVP
jgi:hypothetical protein